MKIRTAVLNDASGIGRVHVNSWRTTYQTIIPDDILNNLKYEDKIRQWQNNIEDPGQFIIVAEADQEIVGYAATEARLINKRTYSHHLTSIYTLKEYQGKGLGRQLLHEIFRHFKKNGAGAVYVEVLKDNKTKYFYEKYGAVHVRDFDLNLGSKTLKESLYVFNSVRDTLDLLTH